MRRVSFRLRPYTLIVQKGARFRRFWWSGVSRDAGEFSSFALLRSMQSAPPCGVGRGGASFRGLVVNRRWSYYVTRIGCGVAIALILSVFRHWVR